MKLYQVNLPGGPVMVFAHTIQRAWNLAFREYGVQCDPVAPVAWDATNDWVIMGGRMEQFTYQALGTHEEGFGTYDEDEGWTISNLLPSEITGLPLTEFDDPFINALNQAVAAVTARDGRASLAAVGIQLRNLLPEFDPRTYGFKKLSDLVSSLPRFDVVRVPIPGGGEWIYIEKAKLP